MSFLQDYLNSVSAKLSCALYGKEREREERVRERERERKKVRVILFTESLLPFPQR